MVLVIELSLSPASGSVDEQFSKVETLAPNRHDDDQDKQGFVNNIVQSSVKIKSLKKFQPISFKMHLRTYENLMK
jgi:hypothetical protein